MQTKQLKTGYCSNLGPGNILTILRLYYISVLLDVPLFIKSHKLRNDNTDDKLKEKISRIRDIK